MRTTKVAVRLNWESLEKLDRLVKSQMYPSRSSAIQEVIDEKLTRLERVRLAKECANLDPAAEQALAEEGLTLELAPSALPKRSWVKISQVRTLSAERIGGLLDKVPPEQMERLIEGLNEIVGG